MACDCRPDVSPWTFTCQADGFEATRRIMETRATRCDRQREFHGNGVVTAFRALEAGALAAVPRPHGSGTEV